MTACYGTYYVTVMGGRDILQGHFSTEICNSPDYWTAPFYILACTQPSSYANNDIVLISEILM